MLGFISWRNKPYDTIIKQQGSKYICCQHTLSFWDCQEPSHCDFHGGSPVVFMDMTNVTTGIGGYYSCEEFGQELRITQLNGGLEFAITFGDDSVTGAADIADGFYEGFIEGHGYLYFHFYDGCVFIFDKLLQSAVGNAPDYVGKYIMR